MASVSAWQFADAENSACAVLSEDEEHDATRRGHLPTSWPVMISSGHDASRNLLDVPAGMERFHRKAVQSRHICLDHKPMNI
jgi:hypothetical protein